MGSLQGFAPAITHWCFGITILIGLVSSEFTGAETILAVSLSGCTATLSAICSCTTVSNDADQIKRKRFPNVFNFLIIWLDVLTYLVAAATCARLASATVDYISKGHFREFLFGLEQHSLGEPWPDVLGVTIILVVTVLFMMGLEKSSTITALLFLALTCNFGFFSFIGSFHTVNNFQKWVDSLKIHSPRAVFRAGALCSFAFVNKMPMTSKNNALKIATIFFMPLLFYIVLAIIFSLMTHYRELEGTAIPLIQIFQNRDVDWARPVIAIFTICVVCLLLTEILPLVYFSFVRLASREWRVFVSSIQYQSRMTGAPVLAIFAAGSLAAILAFACPLSHLIKLLNASCLLRNVLNSCQLVYIRYRPDILYTDIQVRNNTNVQYSKLSQNAARPSTRQHQVTLKERLRGWFRKTPQYIHMLSSPKGPVGGIRKVPHGSSRRLEEQECLLFEDRNNQALNNDCPEQSNSDNEENEMDVMSCSEGDNSGSSTDIDVVVEEYREGLRVATVGKFNEKKPSTRTTSILVIMCLVGIVLASISIVLYILHIVQFIWPDLLAILLAVVIITGLPENASEKSKPSLLPSCLFPLMHSVSITMNIVLVAMIIVAIWEGIVFWTLAGLFLYWRSDCCQCEYLEPLISRTTSKVDPEHLYFEYSEGLNDNIIIAR